MIGHKLEEVQDFGQHVAMLAGYAELVLVGFAGGERLDHRRHLDCFWPGTENDQNFHRGASVIGGVVSRPYSGGLKIFGNSAGRFPRSGMDRRRAPVYRTAGHAGKRPDPASASGRRLAGCAIEASPRLGSTAKE